MTQVTAKKKGNWRGRLYDLKDKCNKIYSEIHECDVGDDKLKFLCNMTCCFDDAIGEVDDLESKS